MVDLGCGTGTFLIGAALLGSSLAISAFFPFINQNVFRFSVGIDCDPSALKIARINAAKSELDSVAQFILADVRMDTALVKGKFDVVITNPPFGTKNNCGKIGMYNKIKPLP